MHSWFAYKAIKLKAASSPDPQELGEVYGPDVFGEVQTFQSARAWRSRQKLHQTLVDWEKELPSFSKAPVEYVCWRRILGKAPLWGERLPEARLRYARRLLTYLSRSRRANKNVVLVSHGHMMQSGLKVFPATAADDVATVCYCGGFMARCHQADAVDSDPIASLELSAPALTPNSSTATLGEAWPQLDAACREASESSEDVFQQAEVQRWEVHTVGLRFALRGLTVPAKRYGDFLARVGADKFSWPQLQALLGELPSHLPSGAFMSDGGRAAVDLSDSATQSSMDMFRRPRAGSLQTLGSASNADGMEQEPDPAPHTAALHLTKGSLAPRQNPNIIAQRVEEEPVATGLVPAFSLDGSFLAHRNFTTSNTAETAELRPAPSGPASLKLNRSSLLSRRNLNAG